MSHAERWIWKIYFLVYSSVILLSSLGFFQASSSIHLYFNIIQAFDNVFLTSYIFWGLQIFFNLLHLVPLFLFAFRKSFLSAPLWQTLLLFRVFFDITGHSYELNQILSLYYANPKTAIYVTLLICAMHIPSYTACYLYAFHRDEVLKL